MADEDPTLSRMRPDAPATLERRVGLQRLLGAVLGEARPLPRLGRWVVERRVGQGGMGAIYRARDPDTGEAVAIKTVEGSGERARFVHEARTLAALSAPGIVRYLDHGEAEDGTPFLVMAWLEGEDLAARLKRGALPVSAVVELGRQAAAALEAAHRAGVVHRDVKPSNLFLVAGDEVRVVDFGISRSREAQTRLTLTGEVLGTPAYMAPEQLQGRHDARTDVYGLGATLYEALTGRPPFVGPQPGAVLAAVLGEPATPPSRHRPEVPPWLDLLVTQMLAKDPDARPADMRAVRAELTADPTPPVVSLAERAPAERAPVRTVHGGELIGRAWELGLLTAALAWAEEERSLALVHVEGAPGTGRTALLGALRPAGWTALRATGRPGATFGALRDLVGEPVEAALADLRQAIDPGPPADRLRLRWLAWLGSKLDEGPVLLVLDDADRADVGSLRLLDAAARLYAGRAWAVVTAAAQTPAILRPDGPRVERVPLAPLTPRSAGRLVTRHAPRAGHEEVAAAVAAAAGRPAHLITQARGLDQGLPVDSGAALARVQALEPDQRRVLRAAALVGELAWSGAIARLLSVPADDLRLRRQLRHLVALGLLKPEAPGAGARVARGRRRPHAPRALRGRAPRRRPPRAPRALLFCDEPTWRATVALCDDAEREASHAALAAWWREVGGPVDATWATHLERAGHLTEASRTWLAVARAAMAAQDTGPLDAALARAVLTAPDAEARADAHLTGAAVAFWRGALEEAERTALAALQATGEGSEFAPGEGAPRPARWFQAGSLALTAAGQRGRADEVLTLAQRLADAAPADRDAAEARAIGLARAVTQAQSVGASPPWLVAALDAAPLAGLGPEARAWGWRARGALAAPSFDGQADAFVAAHRAHLEAGDRRAAAQVALYLGSIRVWTGAWESAAALTRDALADARHLGAAYLETWTRYVEGKRLAEVAPWREAAAHLDDVAAHAAGSPRIQAGAWLWSAVAALREGAWPEAWVRAERAAAAHHAAAVRVPARAAAAWARMQAGERLPLPPPAAAELPAEPAEHVEVVALAGAAWAAAQGDRGGAVALLDEARQRIEARARSISDPVRRNAYLEGPFLVRAVRSARGG
jgi:hypothetical protein